MRPVAPEAKPHNAAIVQRKNIGFLNQMSQVRILLVALGAEMIKT